MAFIMLAAAGQAVAGDDTHSAPGAISQLVGYNWDSAAKVYVMHWDQQSVTAADPSRPFRVAHERGLGTLRVALGVDVVFDRWRREPQAVLDDLHRLLDDADANGLRLVLSNRLDQSSIEALAGRSYSSWAEAQSDLVTEGSPAFEGYMAWLQDVVGAFGDHPAAFTWEATNEPQWMLGIDSGAISLDAAASWLNTVQAALKVFGAARVNMGGALFEAMSDDQLALACEFTDILDDHMYPSLDGAGNPVDTDALPEIVRFAQHVDRVNVVTGSWHDAMIGEFGSRPVSAGWSETIIKESLERGWTALAWEFDAWDVYAFNETLHPEVLGYLQRLSR